MACRNFTFLKRVIISFYEFLHRIFMVYFRNFTKQSNCIFSKKFCFFLTIVWFYRGKFVLPVRECLFKKESMMNLKKSWWRKQKLGLLVILLILKLNKGLRYELSNTKSQVINKHLKL